MSKKEEPTQADVISGFMMIIAVLWLIWMAWSYFTTPEVKPTIDAPLGYESHRKIQSPELFDCTGLTRLFLNSQATYGHLEVCKSKETGNRYLIVTTHRGVAITPYKD